MAHGFLFIIIYMLNWYCSWLDILYDTSFSQVAEDFVRLISEKKPENFKLIISSHNYQSTPSNEELSSLVARIQAAGADIVKIATTAVDIVDVARMFQVIVHCQVSTGILFQSVTGVN